MNARVGSLAGLGDRTQFVRIAIAFGALAFGALLYAMVRPQAALFVPNGWHHPMLASTGLPLASALIGTAPTFLHAFALSVLIMVATRAATSRGRGACCAAVGAAEFAFEVAQHTVVAAMLLGSVSALPMTGGIAGAWRVYLRHGAFDPFDLIAAVAGCLLAYALIARATHDRQTSSGAHHATT
jgi:hypothetical protein